MGIDTMETATPVVLNIWDVDSDLLDSTDDFIGRSLVFLDSEEVRACTSNSDQIMEPKWFPVKKCWASWNSQEKEDEVEENVPQILVSFQLVDFEFEFKLPAKDIDLAAEHMKISQGKINPMPHIHYKEFKCDIMVLGLRNLVSTGLLPIKKAFVKFNLKSVLPLSMANTGKQSHMCFAMFRRSSFNCYVKNVFGLCVYVSNNYISPADGSCSTAINKPSIAAHGLMKKGWMNRQPTTPNLKG